MRLHEFLSHAARFDGRRRAYDDKTYADVAHRVHRAASALRGKNLPAGAHVAIISDNSPFFFEAYLALACAGLVAVPINVRLSVNEAKFIASDSECVAVLHDAANAELASAFENRLAISADDWEMIIRTAEPTAPVDGDENDLAHLCYTGGTTGTPKGVMLSHRNVAASTTNKIVLGKFQRDDVWLHAAPMFHQADSWAVFAFTGLGARHVFMPRFEPKRALALMAQEQVTAFQLVPTMIVLMAETAGATPPDLTHLRRVLYGSAPMPTATLERAESVFGPVFQHIYGLTEAAGTVAAGPWPAEPAEIDGDRRKSCGQAVLGVDLRIATSNGRALAAGEVGRIQARGANVMTGYWRREAESAAAFVDGWLDTGDLGCMDEDGFLFIVDRAKDMIITGGENVYSAEVENVLCRHHAVLEAAVIGLPDARWGEAVTAVVRLTEPEAASGEDLIAHCRLSLAGYKTPKRVVVMADLPKSGAGKIVKAELKQALTRQAD